MINKQKIAQIFGGLFLMSLSTFFFLIMKKTMIPNIILHFKGEKTTGIVKDLEYLRSSGSHGGYHPIIEYKINEKSYKLGPHNTTINSFNPYQIGDKIQLLYDPKNPKNATMKTGSNLFANIFGTCLPIGIFFLGILLLISKPVPTHSRKI